MPAYKQENRSVRIETPFGEDVLLLQSFRGTEALGKPFQYELVLFSEEHELDYEKIIGQNVSIFVEKEGEEPRYFNGFISRFAQTKYEGKLAEYRATVVPWLWFLTRSSNCRIFQNMKIPDILMQVFKDFGFSDIINRLHGNYRTWNYCVQYRETAYNFVSRLMEEEGIYYCFKHESGKHSLVLCDSSASHNEFKGYEQLLYRPSSSNVQEILTSWVVQHEVQSDAYATNNFDFTSPGAYSLASSFQERGYGQSKLEQYDYLGEQSPFDEYSTGAPNENERYSQLRLQELQARFETYHGEGDARGICTGAKFSLKGHPRLDFAKEYLTTGAEYLIQCNPFETSDEYGKDFKFNAKIAAILLSVQFRSPRVTPKPIVYGPQTATVVGLAGQKFLTDPTGYGMVKVQFHWDRLGKSDQNSSCFIRVSQSWASKNWGDMAVPHIGDEVIVECLEGDPDRPIITGRVYNQANMPPLGMPANNDKRIMQDDFGNMLVLDATPGDEHVKLHSPHHNSTMILGRSAAIDTESDSIEATQGNSLETTFGSSFENKIGNSIDTITGLSLEALLGPKLELNVAAQIAANFGFQIEFTRGASLELGSSDNKFADNDMLMAAGKNLNLVAGYDATTDPKTSTMHFSNKSLVATIGSVLDPGKDELSSFGNKMMAATMLLTALNAGLIAGVSSWSDDDNTPQKQGAMLGLSAALDVATVVVLIAAAAKNDELMAKTKMVKHSGSTGADSYDSRLELFTEKQGGPTPHGAALESTHGVLILNTDSSGNNNAINVQADKISIESTSKPIELATSGQKIALSSTGVAITTTKYTVNGSEISLGGALTIVGTPATPAVSTLPAGVAAVAAGKAAGTAWVQGQNVRRLAQIFAPPSTP